MFRTLFLTLSTVLFLSLGAAGARADTVIFSNFGPGMTFNTTHGWGVGGSSSVSKQVIANKFTATSNLNFSSAQLAVGLVTGPPSILQVILETDAGGVPGSIIETINVNIGPYPPGSVVTATSVLNPLLTSGTNYWLVAYMPSAGTDAAWNWSLSDLPTDNFVGNFNASPTGPWYASGGGTRGAFQINGNASLPEPTSMLLLGTGIIGLASRARKRQITKSACGSRLIRGPENI